MEGRFHMFPLLFHKNNVIIAVLIIFGNWGLNSNCMINLTGSD